MKKLGGVILSLSMLAGTAYAGSLTGSGDIDSHTFKAKSYSGSRDRNYKVYVPKSYTGSEKVPMIMALHGCAMDNTDALNNWNLDLIADQNNVIIVFPHITSYTGMRNENCWGYWFDAEIHEGAGEVTDLYSLGKEVETKYSIDPNRRYITGLSSGGAMTVAAAIAYNEYWAAAAPVAGLAYGDWSSSVLSDMFKSLSQHTDAVESELDDDRPIPMLVVNSNRDEIVRITAGELIRDSHLDAFGINKSADGVESCDAEGVNCDLTSYKDSNGNVIVQTMFFDGATIGPKEGEYGKGHYWGGDDSGYEQWAYDKGPSTSQALWNFFQDKSFDGSDVVNDSAECDADYTAPAAPANLKLSATYDNYATLTVSANSEADLKGYKLYRSDGSSISGVVSSTTLTASGLSSQSSYTVYAVAVDDCGNESQPSNQITFSTDAPSYVAPSKTDTAVNFYVDGTLSLDDYLSYNTKYGSEAFTLYQLENGSWSDVNPGGTSNTGDSGSNGDTGGNANNGGGSTGDVDVNSGDIPAGSWSTKTIAGMQVHVYLPKSAPVLAEKRALMINMHGCAQKNEDMKNYANWQDVADAYGMVVATPDAPNGGVIAGCWDYYDSNHSRSRPSRHDDNLLDLAESLKSDSSLNIDADQVYISGLSSGGGQTHVMGCLAPDVFAGIGINAGPTIGTSSGQIGSVGTSESSAVNLCNTFAGSYKGSFDTQITSIVHGTSDYTVATGYADLSAEAMANIYGAAKDSGTMSIAGGGTETTYSDSTGIRVSKIMVSGMSHAWPAGDGGSGGSYIDHNHVDYPAFVTQFMFENNRRVERSDDTGEQGGGSGSVDAGEQNNDQADDEQCEDLNDNGICDDIEPEKLEDGSGGGGSTGMILLGLLGAAFLRRKTK